MWESLTFWCVVCGSVAKTNVSDAMDSQATVQTMQGRQIVDVQWDTLPVQQAMWPC